MIARIALVLGSLGALFGAFWIVLPIVRAWMLPEAGGDLLWVIGPPTALRFGACTVLSALTLPFLLRPLGRRWREQDRAARGQPTDAVVERGISRPALLIRGGLLFVIYAIAGMFYFASHAEVRDATITFHSLLGARAYRYDQVVALQHQAPEGGQVDRYAMEFDDERWGYFDASCEGTTDGEIRAIAQHVSLRARQPWIETRGNR